MRVLRVVACLVAFVALSAPAPAAAATPPPAPVVQLQYEADPVDLHAAWVEAVRRCIVHRESRGDYTARNPSSTAAGAYQFVIRTSNHVARMLGRPDLVGVSAALWPPRVQDRGFLLLFDDGAGRHHWHLKGAVQCWER